MFGSFRVGGGLLVMMLTALAACGDDDDEPRGDTTETAQDTAPADTADTAPDDTADTAPEDTADTTPEDTADGDVAAPEPRVTLVIDSVGAGDLGFNDMAIAGFARAAAEVDVTTTQVTADAEDVFATIEDAAATSDLVIAVGFFFADAVFELAPEFPDVHFAVIDGGAPELDNVSYHVFAVEEASFLAGAAAALTTESKRLGFIGGVDVGVIDAFEAGYRAGAAHIALDVTVDAVRLSRYPDFSGFDDPAAAFDEATRMYEAGADVIFHAAGGSGFGLFTAAAEFSADNDPVWAIGVDVDQYLLVDPAEQAHILTSVLKRVDEAVYRIVIDFAAGTPPAGLVVSNLASGMVGLATSGGHLAAIQDRLDELAADILSGDIVVPSELQPVCASSGSGTVSDGWTVLAGTPVRHGHSVQGCMLFMRESGAETRGGGVCLVADLHGAHPCETLDDCAALPLPEGGFHYCAAPEGSATKTCWTRPGPPPTYCDRATAHTPGVVLTPLAPADALPAGPTTWMSYACLADSDVPGGCATGQAVSDASETLAVTFTSIGLYGTDGNIGDYLGELVAPGVLLEGMTGTIGGARPSAAFEERLFQVDPEIEDLVYAAETYDAVVIAALAAEIARRSDGQGIRDQLVATTTRGDRCTDFASCLALVEAGQDIDYDGQSGPLEMTAGGELSRAPFLFVSFGPDNLLDFDGARDVIVGDASRASSDTPAVPDRSIEPSGGPLRIGTLLPETGFLSFLGVGARAAAELAVADINAAGGVNGAHVELVHTDEGGFDDTLIFASVDDLLEADVDVVIGAMASGQTRRIIDRLIDAGVPQISPSNTSDMFVDYPDEGNYFRTAPADRLQGRALAEAIIADGYQRVAVLALDDDYGIDLATSITAELVALGRAESDVMTVLHAYDGPFDVESLDEVVAFAPDAIVIAGFDEAIAIIDLLAEIGMKPAPVPAR